MSYKDYYTILGVLPSAEDVVIRAAYRSLIQRYHPDRNNNSEESRQLTLDIKEAYEISSNPAKRAAFDQERAQHSERISYYSDSNATEGEHFYAPNNVADIYTEVEEKWKFATEFYPDLIEIETKLRKISYRLSTGFKILIIETKQFQQREELAKSLEQQFLESYFGTNPKVIKFAKKLISDNKRDAARKLNKAINILGADLDVDTVITPIEEEAYKEEREAAQREAERKEREEIAELVRQERERKKQEAEELKRQEQERKEQEAEKLKERQEQERQAAHKREEEKEKQEVQQQEQKSMFNFPLVIAIIFISLLLIVILLKLVF